MDWLESEHFTNFLHHFPKSPPEMGELAGFIHNFSNICYEFRWFCKPTHTHKYILHKIEFLVPVYDHEHMDIVFIQLRHCFELIIVVAAVAGVVLLQSLRFVCSLLNHFSFGV